jgi:outer membrane autotransporter protein
LALSTALLFGVCVPQGAWAQAVITTSGDVSANAGFSTWDVGTEPLKIGVTADGWLNMSGGAQVIASGGVELGVGMGTTGTLTLSGNSILSTSQVSAGLGTGKLVLSGGILRALSDNTNFLSNIPNVGLQGGGVVFDTNGHNIGVSTNFSGSGSPLVKQGAGTLTLSGTNTYTGGTKVSAGTLQLGNGSTAASLVGGGMWSVDVAAGANFNVLANSTVTGTAGQMGGTFGGIGSAHGTAYANDGGNPFAAGGGVAGSGAQAQSSAPRPLIVLGGQGGNGNGGGAGYTSGNLGDQRAASGMGGVAFGDDGFGAGGGGGSVSTQGQGGGGGGNYGSGGGGGGGVALRLQEGAQSSIAGGVNGGEGGGNSGLGGGGAAVWADKGAQLTLQTGGNVLGGHGAYFDMYGGGGGGGVVGIGYTLTNQGGTVSGGDAGYGFNAGGGGGAGVAGKNFTLLHNAGLIAGGTGGGFVNGSGTAGSGFGGAGVGSLGGATVVTGASIQGGLTESNRFSTQVRALAVDFQGGGNTLELRQGYSFAGSVLSHNAGPGAGDTLALGGSTNSSFDLGQLVATGVSSDGSAINSATQYQGFASYAKTGTSTWTLTGTQAVPGNWAISAGTLQLGNGGSTGALDGASGIALASGATLAFNRSDSGLTISAPIAGGGKVVQQGSGAVTLSGNNSYTGTTTINAGTLQVGNGAGSGSLGTGAVSNQGTLVFDRNNTLTVANDISGTGALVQQGSGMTVLAGNNNYAGGTSINAGTLQIDSDARLGAATGALSLSGGTLQTTANTSTQRQITLGANGGNFSPDAGTTLAIAGVIQGAGGLTQAGAGTTVLTGSNNYAGPTTITAGTLQVGNGGSLGSLGSLGAGDVTNNGTLAFNRSDAVTVANNIGGSGGLIQQGSGTTILAGNTSYAGPTQVNAGTLQLTGTANLGGNVNVASGAALNLASTAPVTVGGTVNLADGSALSIQSQPQGPDLAAASVQIGQNVGFNLTGIHSSTDLGRTLISTTNGITGDFATVTIGGFSGPVDYLTLNTAKSADAKQYLASYGLSWTAQNPLAHGTFTLANATDQFDVGASLSNQSPNSALGWDGQSLSKNGAGTLVLSGNNSYTGTTTINAGTLQVGNGGGSGSLGAGAVSNQGTLVFDRNNSLTVANDISGAGALVQQGTGTTTLTGTNSYTGTTTIGAGSLQVGNGGASGSLGSGAIVNNSLLSVNRSDALTMAQNISGSGSLQQIGAGTTTLTGTNSYTGGTVVASGTLQAGSADALPQNTAYYLNQGATLDLNSHALQTSLLMGSGNVQLGSAALTVNNNAGQSDSFGGQIAGAGGLIKQGDGTLRLSGASSYTGGTRVLAGRLDVGDNTALGTGTLDLADGTTLGFVANNLTLANNIVMSGVGDPTFDTAANTTTLTGNISGAGDLTKTGAGTLILSGSNSYSGATTVAQGILQAGAANSLSSASAHNVAAGAVLDLAGYNQTLSSLNNSGMVSLSSHAGATPGTVLKLTGPYVGNNGSLGVSTVLAADGSASDKLLLSGPNAVASGTTTLQVSNAGGLGAQTRGSGIQVIATENGGSLQPGSFTLAGGHVDAGAYEYRLFQTAQGAALQSINTQLAYRSEVPLISALPAQLRQSDAAMLGDLHKRMGDDNVTGTAASNTVNADAGFGRRAWGRILRTDPTITQQGTVSPQSSGHLTGFQAGLDLYSSQNFKGGFYVGQLQGDMSVTGFAGGINNKAVGFNSLTSRYLGLYGTWKADSGLYADAVLQGADYRSYLHTSDNSGAGGSTVTNGSGVLASLEVGQAFALGAHWQIEPQAQISYRSISLKDSNMSLAQVKNNADSDWTLRLGARIKGSFATSVGQFQPYGRINIYKASNTNDVASFIVPAATTQISAKGGYTATELAAGASLQLNKSTSIYGELGKLWANGGDSRVRSGVQASVGVKVLW